VGTAASVAAALAARVLVEVAGEAEATVVAQVEVVRVAQEAIEREPCLSPEMGWDVLCAPQPCRRSATPGRGLAQPGTCVPLPCQAAAPLHTGLR
jgi:hypothetical protein